MKKVLLHSCCAPCFAYPYSMLKNDFEVTAFFFNPNVYPQNEYMIRRDELNHFAKKENFSFVEFLDLWDYQSFKTKIKPYCEFGEGSQRCSECFQIRLNVTAEYALSHGYDFFTTTLTVSPHKNSKVINEIGFKIQQLKGISYLESDFKKNDGFKKSTVISRENNFYRQTYCGCEYSLNERNERQKNKFDTAII